MENKENLINALTLQERYKILEKYFKDIKTDYNALEHWRSRKSLLCKESYSKILKYLNYTESFFSHAIKTNCSELDSIYQQELDKLPIFKDINEIFENIRLDEKEYLNEQSFGYLVRPFLLMFENHFIKNFKNFNLNMDTNGIWSQLVDNLNTKLVNMALKTFVLEINLFKESHSIHGNTETERYHYIIQNMGSKEELQNFYHKYIVLTREMCNCVNMFIENINYVFRNLIDNKILINKYFNTNEEKLVNICFDLGDTHQRGKSVLILKYESGKKLIYKPKNLKIIEAYNKLIEYINLNSDLLDLPLLKSLIFNDFCVEEFIEYTKCDTPQQIERYYKRLGEATAVMYMLKGNDFHMENIIAHGEYPYFIDVETLLNNSLEMEYSCDALREAAKRLYNDVSNTCLLPSQNFFIEKNVAIDLSGMNGKSQEIPIEVLQPANLNTDRICFDYKKVKIQASNNLPLLGEQIQNCYDYFDSFISGFKQTCLFFKQNKEYILKEIYPCFLGKQVRILIRNTKNYAHIIDSLKHPNYLQNYIDRERVLENIWALALSNKHICKSEYLDLKNNDIPIFFTQVETLNLIDSRGNIYKDFFEKSSYQLLEEKLQALDDKEINRQIQIIQLHMKDDTKENKTNMPLLKEINLKKLLTSDNFFIEKAEKLANEILKRAVISERDKTYSWLHLAHLKEDKLQIMDGSLYNGLSGVALFFYYLYKLTNKIQYKNIFKEIIETNVKLVYGLKDDGILTGKSSLLYVLYKVIKEDNNYQYKEILTQLIEFIDENITPDSVFDWVSGYAGILNVMLLIYQEFPEEKYGLLCYKLADLITAISYKNKEKLHGGFAHGTSSLALTMFKSAKILGNKDYATCGKYILNIDRSFFSKEKKAWLSHSQESKDEQIRHHWCHGSVGIGLSRLEMKKFTDDSCLDDEIKNIIHTLYNSTIDKSQILCHGNMGLCDFLLEEYRYSGNKKNLNLAKSLAAISEESYIKEYKINPLQQPLGMFNGLTGIGYECLRVSAPEIVPSVLTLE